MNYNGHIKDAVNGDPLAGATVTLRSGSSIIAQMAADRDGYFQFSTMIPATTISFSRVGYKPFTFPAYEWQHLFELERDEKILDPVIVTSGGKKKSLWALALLGLFLLIQKK